MSARLRFGVIGWPLAHTISPAFQKPALAALGVDADYVAAPTPPEDLGGRLTAMRRGEWDGLNVTIPHKVAVAGLVQHMSRAARRLGAVNTVIRRDGRLVGDNTDLEGFITALREYGDMDPGNAAVVMLGAGGAARAAAWALLDAGAAQLTIANRSAQRARSLAAHLASCTGTRVGGYGLDDPRLAPAVAGARLLVNTTSVGMAGGPAPELSPVPAGCLHARLCVFDIVYRPATTPLLAAAMAAGCATLGGLEMLVLQGAASLTRWLGRPAPVDVMMDAARAALAAPAPVLEEG